MSRRGSGGIDRREFLRRTALVGVGASVAPLDAARALAAAPGVKRRVRLGRTGLTVPDIGFGASRLSEDPDLVRYALDRGVTYFDTAESYRGTASETVLGEALAGQRDRVVLASKVKCGIRTTRHDLMQSLEASLSRLRTDRIDIYFNHAVNDVARLQNPEWLEFVSRARQQGKIRFTGMSGHGGRLVECVDHAVEHDLADVLLVAHNFGQDPSFTERFTRRLDFVATQKALPAALARARAKGVGVIGMKTLRGGRLNDLRPYETDGSTFAQAAFRWVLASGHVDSLIVSMTSREQVDEYLVASGWRAPDRVDRGLLERYEARNGATQCRYGCRSCEGGCPEGVPIAELLRTRMYLHDYDDRTLAAASYSPLERAASSCARCSVRTCDTACPYGIEVSTLTRDLFRSMHGFLPGE